MDLAIGHKILGILTLQTIRDLKDISEGKGRRPLLVLLKEELKLKADAELRFDNLVKHALKKDDNDEELDELEEDNIEESFQEKKGVVFILENIRKMKKAQKVLKSAEVMSLYKKTYASKASTGTDDLKSTKGVLVNKRQF